MITRDCRGCKHNNSFYGCMNYDCEVFIEMSKEYEMEMSNSFETLENSESGGKYDSK